MKNPESDRRPTRREFISLGLGAFVVAATPGVIRPRRARLVRRTIPVMGTIAEVGVVHTDVRRAEAAIDAALAELRAVDRTMTRFSDHSEVGRANLEALKRPVPVSAATATVVASALDWASKTDGAFDPAIGRAVRLWDVKHRQAPPAEGEVRSVARSGLYRALELGRHGGSDVLLYHDPAVSLDLGGIAKGYAVDRAVAALREMGIENALVNAGGDLYAMGMSEDGDAWEVGVRDPANPAGLIARFRMSDRAVATSGDYEQYFDYRGRRYSHLIDPGTGAPRRTAEHSVTVAADRCIDADAGGTAAFGESAAAGDRLVRRVDPRAELLYIA